LDEQAAKARIPVPRTPTATLPRRRTERYEENAVSHPYRGRWISMMLAATFAVTGALAQQARMYGTVLDDQGQPVANAKVILEPVDRGSRVEVVTKGKKGSFLIGIIRPGKYTFKVDAPGMVVVSLKATASEKDENGRMKKEPVWTKSGPIRNAQSAEMEIDDGMEITCDAVIGHAAEITTSSGEKTMATPDQALASLTQQIQQGDCAGAITQLEDFVTKNPGNGRAFYLEGFCDAVLEHDEAALVALAKAQELEPTFAGTSTLMGKVYVRMKKLPEAEAAFRKELENSAAPLEVQSDALLSLGAVLRDQGKDQDAIAIFDKAKALTPNRPEPYVELSALYAKLGQVDKAAAVLDEAKQVGADDPVALLNVGISYLNKKDYAHAEAMFQRVIDSKATNEDLAMAYGLMGQLQLRAGKTDAAVASLKKCLELDPKGRLAAETDETLKALKKK
jgi:Flp pilus assembly protein TadD